MRALQNHSSRYIGKGTLHSTVTATVTATVCILRLCILRSAFYGYGRRIHSAFVMERCRANEFNFVVRKVVKYRIGLTDMISVGGQKNENKLLAWLLLTLRVFPRGRVAQRHDMGSGKF